MLDWTEGDTEAGFRVRICVTMRITRLDRALTLCRPARDGVLVRWGLPVSGPVIFRTDQKGTGRPAKVTVTRREPLKLPAKPFVTERSRDEREVPASLPAPLADAVASSGSWPFVPHEVSESRAVPPISSATGATAKRESRAEQFSDDGTSCSLMFRNCMSQEEKKGKKPALQFCELQKNCQVPASQYSC